jgi:hypothetical protein
MIDIVPADTDNLGRTARRQQARALGHLDPQANRGIAVGNCRARIGGLGIPDVSGQAPMLTPQPTCNNVSLFVGRSRYLKRESLMQIVRRLLLLVSLVGLSCVASLIDPWQVYVESWSDDKLGQLIVWEWPLGVDSGVKITARTNGGVERQLLTTPGDRAPQLVEVAWTKDAVAVLVCDSIQDDILVGYDLNADRHLPENQVAGGIRKQLVDRYRLSAEDLKPYDADPVKWACSKDSSHNRFSRSLVGRTLPGVPHP